MFAYRTDAGYFFALGSYVFHFTDYCFKRVKKLPRGAASVTVSQATLKCISMAHPYKENSTGDIKVSASAWVPIMLSLTNNGAALLESLILYHSKLYTNKTPVLSDSEFDYIMELLEKIKPKSKVLGLVGAAPTKNDVDLPVLMGSLHKSKTPEALIKWCTGKSPLFFAPKYDGVSLLLEYKRGVLHKAYTRGDGRKGRDITHHILSMGHTIKKKVPLWVGIDTVYVRGEAVINKNDFASVLKDSTKAKDPRSLTVGIFNKAKPDAALLAYVDFFAFWCSEIRVTKSLYEDFSALREWIIPASFVKVTKKNLFELTDGERGLKLIVDMLDKLTYKADGIVFYSNEEGFHSNGLDPKGAEAYKPPLERTYKATVLDVQWNLSKNKVWVPKVIIDPVTIDDGTTITKTTGFNARFIVDNQVSKGASILIKRAGQVIPHIVSIVKKSNNPVLLPEGDWNETNVNIVFRSTNSTVKLKRLVHFIKVAGIEELKDGKLLPAVTKGIDTPLKLYKASKQTWQSLPGFGLKSGESVYDNIQAKREMTLVDLIYSSSILGGTFGTSKLNIVYSLFKDRMLTIKPVGKEFAALCEHKGLTDKSVQHYTDNLPEIQTFVKEMTEVISIKEPYVGHLTGKIICFTGVRDSSMEKWLKDAGATIKTGGVTKAVTHVIYKNGVAPTENYTKASALSIPLVEISTANDYFKKA